MMVWVLLLMMVVFVADFANEGDGYVGNAVDAVAVVVACLYFNAVIIGRFKFRSRKKTKGPSSSSKI